MSTKRVTTASVGKRVALYYRVSTEEQVEGYSLDAQARAAKMFCEAHGWAVVAEYRDEGKSAHTDDITKRPDFARMLDDAEAGRFDVIICHKLDRFARNLRVTLETLDRLNRHDVAFVSISEQMDFSTPIGKVILATLAAFAQYYSDNLSMETKKGKHERKRQGMYNGLIPFGLKKGGDGLPVPDPDTYPGLLLAFKAAAEGKSDREIAVLLNDAGYRTTGNRGRNPFAKDTVRRILLNRFYLGELPDDDGGWLPGKHHAVLDPELFAAAQLAREANRHPARKTRTAACVYSLSGIAVCGHCGGRLHIFRNPQGRARVDCYARRQGGECAQRSTFLDIYEAQLGGYLATFRVPNDYRTQIMALYQESQRGRESGDARRRQIEQRLARIKELYRWGDIERDDYQRERDALVAELATLGEVTDQTAALAQAAAFLTDLPAAWDAANQEQRNQLAQLVFENVDITNAEVTAVTVRPEFAPFFALDWNARQHNNGGPGGTADCQQVVSSGSDGLWSRACVISPTMPSLSASCPRFLAWVGRTGPPIRRRAAGSSVRSRKLQSPLLLASGPCVRSLPSSASLANWHT